MSIHSIGGLQVPATTPGNTGVRRTRTPAPGGTESNGTRAPSGDRASIGAHVVNKDLNGLAKAVRVADETMVAIRDYITAIKKRLSTIVKDYPPFPPGSEERVQALKTIAAFRREIIQLSAPDNHPDAAQAAAGAAKAMGRQIHAGVSGIEIPSLPETASNKEIAAAMTSLDDAQKALETRRRELRKAAIEMIDASVDSSGQLGGMSDSSAEVRSREITQAIPEEQGQGFTQDHQLLSGLV